MKLLCLFVLVLALAGCTSADESGSRTNEEPSRFENLEGLKEAFVEAGGQCWGWKVDTSVPLEEFGWKGKGDCDSGTVLILYADEVDVMDEVLFIRKTNESLGLGTSYLIGDNWTINSDQVENVYPKMGGTLMTR